MSDTETITITLTQESDYAFRVAFEGSAMPGLLVDEDAPIGGERGPDPTRLLAASIGHCLSSSLLFALRKFKNQPAAIVTHVRLDKARNARGRQRVARIAVTIDLPEAAAEYAQIERILAQFEEFCTVTESVRAGVPIEVSVRDAARNVLRTSEHSA
jgi:uncharacterized OsmC-like protein